MAENPHSTSPEEPRDDWGPCPDGTVNRLVGNLKHRQQMRQLKQVAAVVGCLFVLVAVGRSFVPSQGSSVQVALSHDEVTQFADDYVRDQLDQEQTQMVDAHIDVCERCAHLREERQAYLDQRNSQSRLIRINRSPLLAQSH